MHHILFTPEAEKEVLNSFFWYENEWPGLGESFKVCLDATLQVIKRNPFFASIVYKDIRSTKLQRFPFSVMYRLKNNDIQIIAVFHQSRNPKTWQSRI